ncbi:OLC1v1000809C1 [Oldenlandia corymbosa var. corymbosa]|uniref:OLC1v1000809C1 n=1 Tax=Oldenlandia corymbosa var. corymbosa TaxID=529605 RepID=A0AAV1D6T5_OLDCO|nr:OLC1v1000809C1 [Oldenlandia corymbosa var. corymbosa]
MSVVFLDGPTVQDFVNDSRAFSQCVDEHFNKLDADGDGVLSRTELQIRSHGSMISSREYELQSEEEIGKLYDVLFEKFDTDQNGAIDREEFKSLMKEIMIAKARGIGNSPVSIILQDDSLLMKAVEHKRSLA